MNKNVEYLWFSNVKIAAFTYKLIKAQQQSQ